MLPVLTRLCQAEPRPRFLFGCTEAQLHTSRYPRSIQRLKVMLHGQWRYARYMTLPIRSLQLWLLGRFLVKLLKFSVLGEDQVFRSRRCLNIFAVTAQHKATFCRRIGLRPNVIPIGYHPEMHGRDLGLEHDVDVAFLGRIHGHSDRRSIILQQVRSELDDMGITLTEAHEYCNGYQRMVFLNQAKKNLNVLQDVHVFTGLRLVLCAANKTLIMSESMRDYGPFIPGKHKVVTPSDNIATGAAYYLRNCDKREAIAETAYELAVARLTMSRTAERMMAAYRVKIPRPHETGRNRSCRPLSPNSLIWGCAAAFTLGIGTESQVWPQRRSGK